MNMTLGEALMLELSTCLQSQSVKWKESWITASHFGQALLLNSPPTKLSFFGTIHNPTIPAPIKHGLQNEIKACNAYCL